MDVESGPDGLGSGENDSVAAGVMDFSSSELDPLTHSASKTSSATNEKHMEMMSFDKSDEMSQKFAFDLQCPMEDVSFGRALYDRCSWLIGLLLFQSCSSYILANNVELLKEHPAIIFYLTMLVGAGGNAGNQAAVRIIRGMALGLITEETKTKILFRECVMGFAMCLLLSTVGLLRVHFSSHTSTRETIAMTLSLSTIVLFSVIIGTLLPFFLKYLNFDPVHASTSIQVVMDISGVLITCLISALILNTTI